MLKIVKANGYHKKDINRLICEAKIGSGIKGSIPRNTWVAMLEGRVVGFANLDFVGKKVAILKEIAVDRAFRHKGIGSALINQRMYHARRRGVNVFALATMYYLFNFYKRRGFATCPRRFLPDFLRNYPQFNAQRYMKCAVMVKGIPVRRRA